MSRRVEELQLALQLRDELHQHSLGLDFSSRAWFQLATCVPMNTPTTTIKNSIAIAVQFWARRLSVRRRRIIGIPPGATPALARDGRPGCQHDEKVAKGAVRGLKWQDETLRFEGPRRGHRHPSSDTEKESDAHPPREAVVVRFAGDSGDGMQLTGGQFTLSTALAGNDLATFPDFPAEIRAPQGTTFGVSAFQINFGSLRDRHGRRPARRAGGDEPGGAQGERQGTCATAA